MYAKISIATVSVFLLVAISAFAGTADELLQQVIERLPREQLNITGDIIVRRQRGIVISQFQFETIINWGKTPPHASYIIRDAFGSDLEQLSITRTTEENPAINYKKGSPLSDATLPDMSAAIQNTDLSWLDLTLSFLWWRGGSIKGSEQIRGRNCTIIEVPAPKTSQHQYAYVRLWIDDEMFMLLQAEAYNKQHLPIRKLWIRSMMKADNRWMIKDMEIQGESVKHRTKLHITNVTDNKQQPESLHEFPDTL